VDLDFLQRLVRDQGLLGRYARRFGIDEQTLAERAALVLRERQWESLANLPSDELKKILMDEAALRRYADELGIDIDKLRVRVEELLQRRMGVRLPEPQPERPPIEPVRPTEHQFRPPEVEGGRGQVLLLRTEKELKPLAVKRLEVLPTPGARLQHLLSRTRRVEEGLQRVHTVRGEEPGRTRNVVPGRTADDVADKVRDVPDQPPRTDQPTLSRTEVDEVVRTRVVTERELARFVPYLPPMLFALPVAVALPAAAQIISQVVGAPVALRLPPPPSGSMPFGAYLRSILPRVGWGGVQREVYVLL
jgi:hypothetical protein